MCRYIEIFRSSLSVVKGMMGYSNNNNSRRMNSRPGPYDRGDRFGGGRFQPRGSRNFKGGFSSSSGILKTQSYDCGEFIFIINEYAFTKRINI